MAEVEWPDLSECTFTVIEGSESVARFDRSRAARASPGLTQRAGVT